MTTTAQPRPYALIRPCPHCPFRNDIDPYLRAGRAREIARSIRDGGEFRCHQTTVPDPDDDAAITSGPDSKVCAGSLIVQEKAGQLGQVTRIAERLGMYDPSRLDMGAPVYDSLTDWVKAVAASEGDVTPTVTDTDGTVHELEHCGVVGPGCEDPAGFMTASGAAANDETPTCNPLEGCEACGNPMCDACRSNAEPEFCVYCANGEEDEL